MVKDDFMLNKYNEIQNKIKEKLNIKFHSMDLYSQTYMKAKVREFNGMINNKLFQVIKYQNKICITLELPVTIDSVKKIRRFI